MTITSLSMHVLFMYLPFLAKTCSSGIQLTMNSDGNILCTLQIFTFWSLSVRSETSCCLVTINLMILKFGMYFASQFDFLSNFLIIIKSPILYCSMSSYLPLLYLEHAFFVLRAANKYVCLSLSKWVMPSSVPKFLRFGSKKAARRDGYGSCLKSESGGFLGVLIGTSWMQQLHMEVVHPILAYHLMRISKCSL